ncbi:MULTISPECIES: TetR family transcriptional regulator [Pseudomonas]|jgi:AcrR family transcriptional regulator|uniref:TetR family transcriptional regulator n=1 Tax=Pseudomonas TaxID=286 RepID=UPI0006D4965D|nr:MULTISPECIES: TetR family transcriptional regulator [Pseudomonas]EIW4151635.1 TetR family transcriptional regulator [Pseudomonas aeruginosa]EKU5858177.1 TetR family transcriptional regulator [Pseudomonas aeruginosa]EKV8093614.1 TetR family transcriptional regulator [Pseudomonas aeruginosa]EKW6389835.1 TetR family transcriptional regulator [Pseudomonas aeruginosa]EKW6420618.1 TetR family transcriptional regulator [Pseudomonas aeruginosa]|tara:strand:+ start:1342 stop:1749 length:408 start_codon:yes stop_codon:yes gene_type:complete
MKTTRKTSDSRERDLRLALARIQRGRAHTGETKVTIAAVAREAGVSTALIHNHYPNVAEAIREAQGRSSRAQRDVKHQDLIAEREKNKLLRQELEELRLKTADLASINEVLMAELRALKARSGDLKIVALPSHKT